MVILSFDQSVDGILAFPVYVPPFPYHKEEFLKAVKQEGEKALEALARQRREERARETQREEKQRDLDHMAQGVRWAIGLEE